MPERKTVFVSCGQYTDEERDLGRQACDLVAECTRFQGYFAQNQSTLKALSENVLRRLYESVGLIVIMHHRGTIEGRNTIRASVWVEQEVAMATLMEQVLGRPLHFALFIQKGIAREGIREQIQSNPIEFTKSEQVIAALRGILPTWKAPLYIDDDERKEMIDSVALTIRTDKGHQRNYTILVENHSQFDVEIKRVCLWSKDQTAKSGNDQRVSKPAFRPDNANWSVPARRSISVQFDAQEDVAQRLWQLAGSPEDVDRWTAKKLGSARQFQIEVRVALRCEISGLERDFEDTRTVQVDFINRNITGL